jgi:anti-sigma-K factor RskA
MTMSSTEHDELREQAGPYVLGALTQAERDAFVAHAVTCVECAAQVQSLSSVADALARAVPQHEPSSTLRARVLASVGGSPATAVSMSSRVAAHGVSVAWLAAAASLALAVALGAYAATLRGRVGALELRLRDATERASESERQIADLRRTAAGAQTQVAVLAAPDLLRIDLAGQPRAPQASARAFWSRSRGLVFTASNLPPPRAGRTYQLWILTAQAAPISAGLFKPDPQGRVAAVFETPLDLPKPIGMAVTMEPDGGVSSPTGEKYLVGL